jgi:hypothetical protein
MRIEAGKPKFVSNSNNPRSIFFSGCNPKKIDLSVMDIAMPVMLDAYYNKIILNSKL